MNNQQAEDLLLKYKAGTVSNEEKTLVDTWYARFKDKADSVPEDQLIADQTESWRQFEREYGKGRITSLRSHLTTRQAGIRLAAAILIILSAGAFFYNNYFVNKEPAEVLAKDIAPGRNSATLTLANGEKIVLSDAVNGKLTEEAGISITKTEDGQIVYEIKSQASKKGALLYNILSTARGEQYRVVLPDGTKVWLNAASSLKYPASFASLEKRQVALTGEGYFEVAKDPARPFIVKTDKQEVEVLGTHFNISNYADEAEVKTTLLEGSVRVSPLEGKIKKVSQFVTLKPGQQSVLSDKRLDIKNIVTEEAVAWKNGLFMFSDESLESILKKVSRWYNLEIIYKDDEIRKEVLGGTITRFDNVSNVLRMLELTGAIRFKIEGRTLIVMEPQ